MKAGAAARGGAWRRRGRVGQQQPLTQCDAVGDGGEGEGDGEWW